MKHFKLGKKEYCVIEKDKLDNLIYELSYKLSVAENDLIYPLYSNWSKSDEYSRCSIIRAKQLIRESEETLNIFKKSRY